MMYKLTTETIPYSPPPPPHTHTQMLLPLHKNIYTNNLTLFSLVSSRTNISQSSHPRMLLAPEQRLELVGVALWRSHTIDKSLCTSCGSLGATRSKYKAALTILNQYTLLSYIRSIMYTSSVGWSSAKADNVNLASSSKSFLAYLRVSEYKHITI